MYWPFYHYEISLPLCLEVCFIWYKYSNCGFWMNSVWVIHQERREEWKGRGRRGRILRTWQLRNIGEGQASNPPSSADTEVDIFRQNSISRKDGLAFRGVWLLDLVGCKLLLALTASVLSSSYSDKYLRKTTWGRKLGHRTRDCHLRFLCPLILGLWWRWTSRQWEHTGRLVTSRGQEVGPENACVGRLSHIQGLPPPPGLGEWCHTHWERVFLLKSLWTCTHRHTQKCALAIS